ncbi:Na+/H+ antiporter subunit B [Myroides odoratus]|uniref:Multiple resistance and pH homeostasis protein B n=1 Tax=Myroides odoratus TaxID=256 RepID=A0A378U0Z6_MYROD|nr:Na+/H+ antiporter subunit B [Myroides odoratus]MCS4238790.1 multicomponent Na+:H+ antiporter subunit B [Myroides odoratus]MDH6602773.1 multicomponent Na+:H+ antiporter subunit B [Myroides gitamensis]QQU03880.1 Na+/H+ antiporter subunit B [Myroides odoratus]STZ68837.1 Multiple resistance and pH homeostasis protein B [Myroides odoratus]
MRKYQNKHHVLDSTILRTATNYLLPLLILFSLFVLLRGHYLSGGGFVGGLIASIAFVLHSFAYSTKQTLALFQFSPMRLIGIGLSLSILSAILPVFLGLPVMTGVWFAESVAVIGAVGTALFFDIGVYLVVIGVVLTILFTIAENV